MSEIFGDAFAVNRYRRYKPTVHWMYHSDYMQCMIARAHHNENDKPCALYRAKVGDDRYVVGESLNEVKNTIRLYKSQGESMFKFVKQEVQE